MFFAKKTTGLTDQEIIAEYKRTLNKQLLGELFLRYSHLMYGVSFNYLRAAEEAKDAVMAVFEQLDTLLLKHEVKNFRTWVHSVVKNYCLVQLRKDKMRNITDPYDDENNFMENEDFFHLLDEEYPEFSAQVLLSAVNELEENQKKCIRLFYLEDKSYQEINSLTGLDFNKVKSCIQNGKRNLKIKILKKGITPDIIK